MNNLTYDVVSSVVKIDKEMIIEIDEIEDWTIGVHYFGDFLKKCDNNPDLINELFEVDMTHLVHILACVKTSYLVQALQKMATYDYSKFINFIEFVNENNSKVELAKQIHDRILLLYRITIFPDLFSNDNFVLIYNTLKEKI